MIPLTQLKLIMCADTNVQDDKTKVEKALNSDMLLVDKYKTVLSLFVSHHHGKI